MLPDLDEAVSLGPGDLVQHDVDDGIRCAVRQLGVLIPEGLPQSHVLEHHMVILMQQHEAEHLVGETLAELGTQEHIAPVGRCRGHAVHVLALALHHDACNGDEAVVAHDLGALPQFPIFHVHVVSFQYL